MFLEDLASFHGWQEWEGATMANIGTSRIQAVSIREIYGPLSQTWEFAGGVEPREKDPGQVRTPERDRARSAPELPAGRARPARGALIGILLGAGLWVVIFGLVFLLMR
jgi:hypothetical protein